MIRLERLSSELQAQSLPGNVALHEAVPAGWQKWWPTASWHERASEAKWVRVDWPSAPTSQQQSAADAVIQAHDGQETESELLSEYPMTPRVLAAAAVRASTQFLTLSTSRKAKVQAIIDEHAGKLIDAVGWGA